MNNVFKSIPYSFYENYCGYVESKNSKPVAEDVIFSVLDSEGCRLGSDETLNTGDMYIVLESGRYFLGSLVGCREDDGACMLFELFNDDDMDVYISADRHTIRKIPVEHVKPDLEMVTGAVIEIKLGSGDFEKVGGFKNLIEDAQIEAKAEELYNIYHEGDSAKLEWGGCDLSGDEFPFHERFRAIARHLATPQSDVQHALQAALESERELMDILRKIGKVFGKNVGTDIGVLDLPKLVEKELWEIDGIACENKKLHLDAKKAASELEAHKHNSKQMLRLNSWLQENNLGKLGECVTDTIIELLEEAMKPKAPIPHMSPLSQFFKNSTQ